MISDLQQRVKDIEKMIKEKTAKNLSAYAKSTMLASEVGELCDEVVALEGDRIEDKDYDNTDALAKEIVDVIFNALTIANHYNVELESHLLKRLDKIVSKFDYEIKEESK
jgi:NTP pyrophosphatase (non-canonical NTP hydrolase)